MQWKKQPSNLITFICTVLNDRLFGYSHTGVPVPPPIEMSLGTGNAISEVLGEPRIGYIAHSKTERGKTFVFQTEPGIIKCSHLPLILKSLLTQELRGIIQALFLFI